MTNAEKLAKKYAIFNSRNERMYQFGWYEHLDVAEMVMREVAKKYRFEIFHVSKITIEK